MELQKRRKTITETETRWYMKQIIEGVGYLHSKKIIHRDLKLGNIFLDDALEVKIGDFGLAAKIEFVGERKRTLCGTPNYIAPEVLNKKGHSFEVDIWSIGCIMYTLLMGKPPFETTTLKETYARIKKCDYKFSRPISSSAKDMIVLMLQYDPKSRAKICDLAIVDFMINGYIPSALPVSALSTAPRFDTDDYILLVPLTNKKKENRYMPIFDFLNVQRTETPFNSKENLTILKKMLSDVIKCKPAINFKFNEEMTDPSAQPIYWVSKWVDYSDKYGFGYQLCDGSVGVMYNDSTKLILLSNKM